MWISSFGQSPTRCCAPFHCSKKRLQLNVELASPDPFVPVPPGWEQRSPVITRIGRVTFRHSDFVAQALAKIERGRARDLVDVQAMLAHGLISAASVRARFALMEPELFRFPALDLPSCRRAVDTVSPPSAHDLLMRR